jgi:hypothetical protein
MRGFTDEVTPHQLIIEAFGVQVRACASSAELLMRMQDLLPPGWREVDGRPDARRIGIVDEEDGTFSVYNYANRVCERGGPDLALVVFNDQVQSFVALNAPDMIFVHAGVVAQDGEAVVIPGESFSGKSTLVEALVRRGAIYYSDEFAVVDSEGRIHPYARPLTLRRLQLEGETWSGERTVESLGGVAGHESLPLRLAVVTHYVPGAEWQPQRLSTGEAALALMSNAPAARYRPEECLRLLSRAVREATVLEGERGEAEEFAEMLLEGAVA